MKVDGVAPGQGNQADKLAAKRAQPAPAKSFADALKKASQTPGAPASGAPAAHPPVGNDLPPPADDHMGTIKYRMQTGYYNNPKVDDALSDKLSGYFDDVA
jgi:hypothetical protein